ncbi:ABC transporter permease [Pediococcus ethanolidurans]|uniref:ABC transporter permease n=1 Tax=Pediococcus ethanolidurans TaxID=319653 RepID=UPI001C1EBB4C|nr:iron export ABC transporter permease subunit FetB [Pediococcus ethanolidurans]MBU7554860.1 iron export ABC transporter permease subunit FetB [Pediococcus ethanolidurans]MBU7563233.1 iron export ABC transporter permease subunit FetB [Pediococcus ethanolidurans]MCV3321827.1 iron export ABC transporter permease subunit FetB [Pediococcus ethanolidurans]MCV3323168.1 iron export ABC transporter permease subunit FetB [Pediococcus ethanolidurans]MCV3327142.1 iron export ABC transporter permease sub
MNLDVNNWSLTLALLLVMIALWIGYREKLGIDREIIIGVIRAVIQLFVVGYLLKYIFKVNNVFLTFAMLLIIIFNASWNAQKRSNGMTNALVISFVAILVSTGVTLGVLILSGAIKLIPSQVIPISGMIASNSMVAIGLSYRSMNTQFRDQRQSVLERLALGGSLRDASIGILRESIKTGMAPTIDSAKTVGIVSLPGMMSGLIFAGVDPVHAIKYQIMVTFMLLSATSLGSVIACYMAYRNFYNTRKQLKESASED